MPDLVHNLLSSMQLRLNDVTVNDVPRFLTEKPTLLIHSLIIPADNIENPYVIPVTLLGVASLFPTSKPIMEEFESLPQIILTSEEPASDSHDTSIAKHEDALAKAVLETGDRMGFPPSRQLCQSPKLCRIPVSMDLSCHCSRYPSCTTTQCCVRQCEQTARPSA
jgi:hypothetical protein